MSGRETRDREGGERRASVSWLGCGEDAVPRATTTKRDGETPPAMRRRRRAEAHLDGTAVRRIFPGHLVLGPGVFRRVLPVVMSLVPLPVAAGGGHHGRRGVAPRDADSEEKLGQRPKLFREEFSSVNTDDCLPVRPEKRKLIGGDVEIPKRDIVRCSRAGFTHSPHPRVSHVCLSVDVRDARPRGHRASGLGAPPRLRALAPPVRTSAPTLPMFPIVLANNRLPSLRSDS